MKKYKTSLEKIKTFSAYTSGRFDSSHKEHFGFSRYIVQQKYKYYLNYITQYYLSGEPPKIYLKWVANNEARLDLNNNRIHVYNNMVITDEGEFLRNIFHVFLKISKE